MYKVTIKATKLPIKISEFCITDTGIITSINKEEEIGNMTSESIFSVYFLMDVVMA